MNDSEYLVTKDDINTAGQISYWRLSGDINLDQLKDAWQKQSLDPKLLPSPPGDSVALGRAMHGEEMVLQHAREGNQDVTIRRLVRPLAHSGAWAVVQETVRDGSSLTYSTLFSVVYAKTGPVFKREQLNVIAYDEIVQRVRDNYDRMRGQLTANDISSWLVKLGNKCSSVPLRDTGGIYFVPRAATESWNRAVAAITSVSAHRIFRIPALKTSEAVDAITDAITQETEAIVAAIEKELQSGKLGDRALQTRRAECEGMLAKVSAYDSLLGVQLKCRERVESLQAAITATALLEGSTEAA